MDWTATPDRFAFVERRTLAIVVGVLFYACGAVLLWYAGMEGGRESDLGFGGFGALLGLVVLAVWPRRVAIFDRPAGTAQLATLVGWWIAGVRVIPLDDIVDVVTQHATPRASGQVLLPALVLRSGERVPLVSDHGERLRIRADAAHALREWLGLAVAAPAFT
jgi:hypothetical protein